jgi:hypothetical protein
MCFDICQQFVAFGVEQIYQILEFHELFWTVSKNNIQVLQYALHLMHNVQVG